jgi:hypothetical protein
MILPFTVAFHGPLHSQVQHIGVQSPQFEPTKTFLFDSLNLFAFSALNDKSPGVSDKVSFLECLDSQDTLNLSSKSRSALLDKLIADKVTVSREDWKSSSVASAESGVQSLSNPGSKESFEIVAPGNWKVIYAPHMTTMAGLGRGSFDVQYTLNEDGTMESHARYEFPFVGKGFLSVSGTYGSVDDNYCRVDFDKFWVKVLNEGDEDEPYKTFDQAPKGPIANFINSIGGAFFIDGVSTFPVSFLDDDLIVFDFELLGTRITGKKI